MGFQEKYSIKTVLPPAEKSQRCQEPRNVRVTGDFKHIHTDWVSITPHHLPKSSFLVAINDCVIGEEIKNPQGVSIHDLVLDSAKIYLKMLVITCLLCDFSMHQLNTLTGATIPYRCEKVFQKDHKSQNN